MQHSINTYERVEESKVFPLTRLHHLTIGDLVVPNCKMRTLLSREEFRGVNNFESGSKFPEVKMSRAKNDL